MEDLRVTAEPTCEAEVEKGWSLPWSLPPLIRRALNSIVKDEKMQSDVQDRHYKFTVDSHLVSNTLLDFSHELGSLPPFKDGDDIAQSPKSTGPAPYLKSSAS